MDNNINLNLTPYNYNPIKSDEQDKNPVEKSEAQALNSQLTPLAAKDILEAMHIMSSGQHNIVNKKDVNPAKYLTPERITDIEASMVSFENETGKHLSILEDEFGHLPEFASLSEADKYEMAAKSLFFTQEEAA